MDSGNCARHFGPRMGHGSCLGFFLSNGALGIYPTGRCPRSRPGSRVRGRTLTSPNLDMVPVRALSGSPKASWAPREITDLEVSMLKVTVKETGNLRQKLADLARRSRDLHGQHEIRLSELISEDFLASCSSFSSFEELLAGSPFEIKSTEDFKAIPEADWDTFIGQNTSYPTWREMQEGAVREWTRGKLGLK